MASDRARRRRAPSADRRLDEVESAARIGSYSVDLLAGRWESSKGLDAIFGIDGAFDRSVEGWASLIHPAERDAVVAYLVDEVAGRGQAFDRQYRILRADTGDERWVHGRGALELDASGRPVRMLGTIADITDQRRSHDALVASELRYAAIVEGTAEAIVIADATTRRLRWVNAAACTLLGYDEDELLRLAVPDIHPRQDLPTVLAQFQDLTDGRITVARSVPCLRKDGTTLLVDIKGSAAVLDGVACTIGFFTDVTELRRLEEGLRRSERNLAEAQRIAHIGSWERDLATGTLSWSDESHRMFGIEPGTFAGTVEAYLAFVHPDDRSMASPSLADLERGGRRTLEYRIIRADGALRLVHEEAEVIRDEAGHPIRYVGTTQDITERVAADEERSKLVEGLRRGERNLAEAQRIAHIGSWEWDLVTDTAQRSEELHRIYGVEPGAIPGTTEAFLAFVHPDDRARVQAAARAAITRGAPYGLGYRIVRTDGAVRIAHDEGEVIRDEHGAPIRMVGTVQDVTERVAAEEERTRLATAVEQTSDSVVITDLAGTIEYVNPAFELVSGYRREEVIGKNPRILQSGRQPASFYRALWRRLTRGQAWNGTFVNRRADGTLYQVESTISPRRGANGLVSGYIGVARDITALQAARSRLATEFRERAQVAAALGRLQPGQTAEETATTICDELLGLPGIDLVAIFTLLDPEHAFVLASAGPENEALVPGRPLPTARASYLHGRAVQGPWAEAWRTRREDGQYGRRIAQLGLRASAFAPIRNGEGLLGVVAVGTTDPAYARHLIDHLPVVGEFAATTSALLARDIEGNRRITQRRAQIEEVIAGRAYHPVFQPIIQVVGGDVVGHEALTRFTDGTRPDLRFAEAWTVDLGADLELTTLDAAITHARELPAGLWLNVNVSPRLLVDPERVRAVLAKADRPLVVEITEHDTVADYRVLRDAIGRLGDTVRTAVDDAGAGIANFAHIVELRPDFVKLDISLVHGVDADLGRQAIVVAMRHFAQTAGCRLIAEGVETEAEAACLASLGVTFAQGYWYGRPEVVATLVAGPHGS